MRARTLANSPLAVVTLGITATSFWTCAYEPPPPAAPVAVEEPSAGAEVAEAPAPEVETPESVVDYSAVRLLGEVDPELPGMPIAIQDRDGQSMEAFHRALLRAAAGEGQARAVFFGASHVASDLFTGYLREELQRRYGDAGHGFVVPVHPWRSYRHRGISVDSNYRRWETTRLRATDADVAKVGLAGVAVETDRAAAYGAVETVSSGEIGQHAGVFDLYYMKQPGGGDFDVYIDHRRVHRVRTRADAAEAAYQTFRVEDGPHRFEIRTIGNGKVRIFGVSVERERPGVIVDTLGINGARARLQLLWDDHIYREHLARRNPDLVVLAYGTNESGDDLPIEEYYQQLTQVVTRVREVTPSASCLLIGPSDRPVRVSNDEWEDRPRTAQIVETQLRVALEQGCGFFDLVAFSGGPMSMVEWAAAEPPYGQPDHVHYTRRGYQRLGEVLFGAVMEGYGGPDHAIDREGEPETAIAHQGGDAPEEEAEAVVTDDG